MTQQVLLCSSCTSPGLRANAVPTSQYVEIGLCELATSRRLFSPIGPLLGSISASNTPPPLPQQGLAPTLGMASSSAGASHLSTRAIGVLLRRALLSLVLVSCSHSAQHVPAQHIPAHLPLVEAKRCLASSAAYHVAWVSPPPRHCLGMHNLHRSSHAWPTQKRCTTCMVTFSQPLHGSTLGSQPTAATQDLNDKYFPAKTRPYSFGGVPFAHASVAISCMAIFPGHYTAVLWGHNLQRPLRTWTTNIFRPKQGRTCGWQLSAHASVAITCMATFPGDNKANTREPRVTAMMDRR